MGIEEGTNGGGASVGKWSTEGAATAGCSREQVTAIFCTCSWDSSGWASRTMEYILSYSIILRSAGSSSGRAAGDAEAREAAERPTGVADDDTTVAYDGVAGVVAETAGIIAGAVARKGPTRPGGAGGTEERAGETEGRAGEARAFRPVRCGSAEAKGANRLLRNISGRAGEQEGLSGTGSRRGNNGLTGGKAGEHNPCERDKTNVSYLSMDSAILVAAACSSTWRARTYSSSAGARGPGNS